MVSQHTRLNLLTNFNSLHSLKHSLNTGRRKWHIKLCVHASLGKHFHLFESFNTDHLHPMVCAQFQAQRKDFGPEGQTKGGLCLKTNQWVGLALLCLSMNRSGCSLYLHHIYIKVNYIWIEFILLKWKLLYNIIKDLHLYVFISMF